ncbi:MAG TPA: hypothetical protein VGK50_04525 [Coriobacteriia bacterium]
MAEDARDGSRVVVEPTGDGVRIRVPGPRSRWTAPGFALLVPVATYVLFGSVIFAEAALETGRRMAVSPVIETLFVLAVLLVPAALDLLAAAALVVLLYHAWGRESVVATPWMLADVRGVLLFSRRRRWPAMRLSNLRLAPMSGGPAEPRTISRRGILFEVDGRRTRGIAQGCTPQEAAEVLDAVQAAMARPTITR